MKNQYQIIQRTLSFGPGISFNATRGDVLWIMVFLPNSIKVNTFMTQPNTISQRRTKPVFAPTNVVAISSPEPTMEPAIIIPGPRCFRMSKNRVGAGFIYRNNQYSGEIFLHFFTQKHDASFQLFYAIYAVFNTDPPVEILFF